MKKFIRHGYWQAIPVIQPCCNVITGKLNVCTINNFWYWMYKPLATWQLSTQSASWENWKDIPHLCRHCFKYSSLIEKVTLLVSLNMERQSFQYLLSKAMNFGVHEYCQMKEQTKYFDKRRSRIFSWATKHAHCRISEHGKNSEALRGKHDLLHFCLLDNRVIRSW